MVAQLGTKTLRGERTQRRFLRRFLALGALAVATAALVRVASGPSTERVPALQPSVRLGETLRETPFERDRPSTDVDHVRLADHHDAADGPIGVRLATLDAGAYPVPFSIDQGETLGNVLDDLGVPASRHASVVEALSAHLDVRRIRPGAAGLAYHDNDGQLARMRMRTPEGWVEADRIGDDWRSGIQPFVRTVKHATAHGRLDQSLEQAVRGAGAPLDVAYKMAFVLQWDLDFTRDLRIGDVFHVLFEQVFLDDAPSGPGDVLGLVYENRGHRFEAYRFEGGYYDGQGRPLQKMFLRSPLPFSRVTSRFSRSRFHPVLKVNRPHWGVDYGAPTGTPVRAPAGGEVVFAGRKGGAGNMVELRHVAGYRSMYLHLSRFAKTARRGRRVAQGDVIGFVGSTGLSTGPHLDYRVKKDGKWIDPLSLHRTPSEPIPPGKMPAFKTQRDTLRQALGLAEMDLPVGQQIAAGTPTPAGPTTAGN